MKPALLLLFALATLWYAPTARATDPCPQLRTRTASTDVATRIAANEVSRRARKASTTAVAG